MSQHLPNRDIRSTVSKLLEDKKHSKKKPLPCTLDDPQEGIEKTLRRPGEKPVPKSMATRLLPQRPRVRNK